MTGVFWLPINLLRRSCPRVSDCSAFRALRSFSLVCVLLREFCLRCRKLSWLSLRILSTDLRAEIPLSLFCSSVRVLVRRCRTNPSCCFLQSRAFVWLRLSIRLSQRSRAVPPKVSHLPRTSEAAEVVSTVKGSTLATQRSDSNFFIKRNRKEVFRIIAFSVYVHTYFFFSSYISVTLSPRST